jgi:hypothetical protein
MGSLGFMDHPGFGDRIVCRLCGRNAHLRQGPPGDPGQGLHLRVTRAVAQLPHRVLRSDCGARLASFSLCEITKQKVDLKRRLNGARPILKGLARFLKTIHRSECIQALTAKPEIAITQSGLGISGGQPIMITRRGLPA